MKRTDKYKKELEEKLYSSHEQLNNSDWLLVFLLGSHEFMKSKKQGNF